MMFDLISFA